MSPKAFQTPSREHPFAIYVRILGKGKTGSRSFNRKEAADAFGMILRDEVDPLQLGAFLMLLRVKEETGEELAGFVDACRTAMIQPLPRLSADLDWSSYAGKKHQHPWYLLSMLLLSQAGYTVFVHGGDGHTVGRLYTEQAMHELGLPVAADWQEVLAQLEQQNLSYLPLRAFCPKLHDLIQLRPAAWPAFAGQYAGSNAKPPASNGEHPECFPSCLCGHFISKPTLPWVNRTPWFSKAISGEIEVKPQADTKLQILQGNVCSELVMSRSVQRKVAAVSAPDTKPLRKLWHDREPDSFGLDAVLATASAALLVLEPQWNLEQCQQYSQKLWQERDQRRLD